MQQTVLKIWIIY